MLGGFEGHLPESKWPAVKERLGKDLQSVKMGSPEDFSNFFNAVIDQCFPTRSLRYRRFEETPAGGGHLRRRLFQKEGYFIEPTVILSQGPRRRHVRGDLRPVLTIYVYKDADFEKTLEMVDQPRPSHPPRRFQPMRCGAIGLRKTPPRSRQFLYQRTMHRRGGRAATFGGARGFGHQRQGGLGAKPIPLVVGPHDQAIVPPNIYRYPFMEK